MRVNPVLRGAAGSLRWTAGRVPPGCPSPSFDAARQLYASKSFSMNAFFASEAW